MRCTSRATKTHDAFQGGSRKQLKYTILKSKLKDETTGDTEAPVYLLFTLIEVNEGCWEQSK